MLKYKTRARSALESRLSAGVVVLIVSHVSPPRKPAWKDGSTATCVLAVDNILYIANLGDSRVCGPRATHLDTSMSCGEVRGKRLLSSLK